MFSLAETKQRKRRKDAGVPKQLSDAHKRKMAEGRARKKRETEKAESKSLRETVKRLEAQVERAKIADDKATEKLHAAGGAKRAGDKVFNEFIRANATLLNATTALNAHRARLERE